MKTADLREGGRWTLAQRAKNDAIYALASASVFTMTKLSPRTLRAIGRAIGILAHRLLAGPRRIAEANVARVFPELEAPAQKALVAESYRTLGGYLGDALVLLDPKAPHPSLPFAPGSRAALDDALASGKGVVLASAHLGPWERVAATLVASGVPFSAVAREAYDPRLMRLYERLRGARGVPAIYRGHAGAPAALIRMLRRNGILGIPMDLATRAASVEVPFLGSPALTPVGPARLALRTGARVVVGVASRVADGAALELTIVPITTHDLTPSPDAEQVLSRRINDALSAQIRALPEAWVWMHPRWAATGIDHTVGHDKA